MPNRNKKEVPSCPKIEKFTDLDAGQFAICTKFPRCPEIANIAGKRQKKPDFCLRGVAEVYKVDLGLRFERELASSGLDVFLDQFDRLRICTKIERHFPRRSNPTGGWWG